MRRLSMNEKLTADLQEETAIKHSKTKIELAEPRYKIKRHN